MSLNFFPFQDGFICIAHKATWVLQRLRLLCTFKVTEGIRKIIYLLEVNLQVSMVGQRRPIILPLGMEIHGIYWEQMFQTLELMLKFMVLQWMEQPVYLLEVNLL